MFALNQNNFLKHDVDVNASFDTENAHHDKKAKLQSLLITIAFHAMLLLLFLYFVLRPPDPPLSDSGVYLNLGMVEVGSGDIQPEGIAKELQAPSPEASTPSSQKKTEDILTQETNEDVPVMQKKEDQKKNAPVVKTETKKTTPNKNPPVVAPPKAKALYPGSQANTSTSEGTGTVKGDQGKPTGDVKGTDYTGNPGFGGPGGGGSGNKPDIGMSGRKVITWPTIIDNSQKTGRVVVNVKVDKLGNVVWAKATQKSSSTTDAYLFQLAEDAALKTKVNADPNAAEEQFGTFIYTFRVK